MAETKKMKIKLVNIESGISAIGFRRIAAIAKASLHDVEILFVPTDNHYKTFAYMFPDGNEVLKYDDVIAIVRYLEGADVIMFSSMTIASKYVKAIINYLRMDLTFKARIIWGGAHPTLYPEEALRYADEICRGEGEEFIRKFVGVSMHNTHSFQGYDCRIYNFRRKTFRPLTGYDYSVFNGSLFRTLWTTGCPFSCSYCANDALVRLDKGYRKLKYKSVDWIITEVELALKQYPFITTIAFDDDNFISLPMETIIEFSHKWVTHINKPFVIYGMHPNTVNKDKVEYLAAAGMNRCRMGIQSGSPRILELLNRTTKPEKIIESANILIDISKKYNIVPPAFDIITDIPGTRELEKIETVNLLWNLHRPYTLTIFSLRSFKGTKLYDKFPNLPTTPYTQTEYNNYNTHLYLLAICKTPEWMITKIDSKFYNIIKFIYHVKRGIDHIIHKDFSRISGKWGYWIWKIKNFLLIKM